MSAREGYTHTDDRSRLTLDVIGPVAMGRDFRSLHTAENKVAESFASILEPTREKIAFLAFNFIMPQWFAQKVPWRLNKVVAEETGFLRDLCREIVQEKRAAIAASGATAEELEADILGTMMIGGDFTDSELVDQMLTFLAAGVSVITSNRNSVADLCSTKPPPAPSPGPATSSASTQRSRSGCASRSANASPPAMPPSPGTSWSRCRC